MRPSYTQSIVLEITQAMALLQGKHRRLTSILVIAFALYAGHTAWGAIEGAFQEHEPATSVAGDTGP